ncbi:TetR/AcrR family transcriptional regulator [Nocardia bovistercoris]|uniref:TetR/AcrR family transcriptional regulator n=1 Tax=Nocardia bovistercoris TaxID=2785916 RepID=A0A931N7M2_9NOCA|nr:TetR/AcrR family transcriptional regulator [Nocardia bovistercoris]MBH0780893.1 TetR/AcrR family transcriptional regulator [Nocardia bovistercoris]
MAPQNTIDRARIVDAAVRMLERGGVDGLSMRRLAEELGTKPMTIYHYVPSKSELLTLALGELAARIEWTRPSGTPRERMLAVAIETYTKLDELRWIVPILRAGTHVGVPALVVTDQFVAAALEAGLGPGHALALWRSTWHLISGELLRRSALATRPRGEKSWHERLSPADLTHAPTIAELLPRWTQLSAEFDLGAAVEALIDGTLDTAK